MARKSKRRRGSKTLSVLAGYMCCKGLLLLAVTAGVLHLLNKDVETVVTHWIESLRIDPDNHLMARLLSRLGMIHNQELKQVSVITGGYAALFLTEGVGLAFRQRWAEYLTLVATGLLIPVELYELCKQITWMKIALLLINVCVFVFLFRTVRENDAKT
jgi:uncharacterized membrane protein (DUF2068 family)